VGTAGAATRYALLIGDHLATATDDDQAGP
jgi:hypothetical protein